MLHIDHLKAQFTKWKNDTFLADPSIVLHTCGGSNLFLIPGKLENAELCRIIGIICIGAAIVLAAISIVFMSAVLLSIILGSLAFVAAGVGIALVVHGESFAKSAQGLINALPKESSSLDKV